MKIHSKYLFFTLVFLSFISSNFAQNSTDILCRVIDIQSKDPVSFATIKFEESNSGIIADINGEFRLPLKYVSSNKVIIISSIGFESLVVKANTLKPNTINVIYLTPKIEALDTVLITGKTKNRISTAREIVQEAIKQIPVNYPLTPHSYIAYYRDYQLVNDNYYNLNESILENFDAGFNTNKYYDKDNKSVLYSYNLNNNYYQDTLLLNSIYGKSKVLASDDSARLGIDSQNELEILNIHNPIRNYDENSFSFVYVLKDDFVKNHIFKLSSIKYVDNIPLYEIDFVAREELNAKYIGAGKIYIAKFGFAIHKIEYNAFINENFRSNTVSYKNYKDVSRKSGDILFEVNIEYKVVEDKMFLNYMTFNNRFIIKEPNPFKVAKFEFDPNDEAFYITFNKSVDPSSITQKSKFRLLYKNKKLIVKTINLIKSKVIKIEVMDWAAGTDAKLSNVEPEDFSFRVKRIKDVFGAVLDRETKLIGYQFREFFTQEIFENKLPPTELIFVNKNRPLSITKVNNATFDIEKYWINSPLKQTKGDN